MVFAATLLAAGLAATALAAPAPLARRGAGRSSRPIQRTGFSDTDKSTSTSTNWAGAVLESYSNEWREVVGTFTVPTPKLPSGASSGKTYSASIWVGIDGDSCQSALWQTGVDINIKGSSVSYDSWWEWIPDNANPFSGIDFKAGDTVALSVVANSKTTGTATIENQTNGGKVTKSTTGSASLCFQDAEWIVEDFEQGGSLVPLANWGSVTFTNASVITSTGASQGPSGADTINLKHSGAIVSSTTTDDSSVTVKYTGS